MCPLAALVSKNSSHACCINNMTDSQEGMCGSMSHFDPSNLMTVQTREHPRTLVTPTLSGLTKPVY